MKTLLRLRRCLLAAFSLELVASSAVVAEPMDRLEARLQRLGSKTRTLQASFEQRRRLKLFQNEMVRKGSFSYSRPDRLRWEILGADRTTLIVRGKRALLKVAGEKERRLELAQAGVLGAVVNQLLVLVGGAPAARLHADFSVSHKQRGQQILLLLKPRGSALRQQLVRLEVTLTSNELNLHQIVLHHPNGDRTTLTFSKFKRNAQLPAALFSL